MNTLRLEIIYLQAPYRVKQREDKPQHYYFRTDFGVEYDICIEEDFSIIPSGAYTLDITNREHTMTFTISKPQRDRWKVR